MAPARKKTKTEPADNEIPPPPHPETRPNDDKTDMPGKDVKPSATGGTEHSRTGSWYSSATSPWRNSTLISKAAPLVAQVARESISVAQGVSSSSSEARQSGEVRSDEEGGARRPSQSQNVSKSFKVTTRKSIPLVAEATKVHATSDLPSVPKGRKAMGEKSGRGKQARIHEERKEESVEAERKDVVVEDAPLPPEPESEATQDVDLKDDKDADPASVRAGSGSWFYGFWSRPDGYGSDVDKREGLKSANKAALDEATDGDATNTPLPTTPENEPTKVIAQPDVVVEEEDLTGTLQPEVSSNAASSRSWFGLWSSKINQQAVEEEQQRRESEQRERAEEHPDVEATADAAATAKDKTAADPKATTKAKDASEDEERPRSSGWAFWSKEPAPSADLTQKQVGELAVADTPSQSHPEAAQFNERREDRKSEELLLKQSSSLLRLKRGNKKKSKDLSGETTAAGTPDESQVQPTPTASGRETPVEAPAIAAEIDSDVPQPIQRGKKTATQSRPNLILPSFRDTYPRASNPGYMDKLTSYIGQTLHISGFEPPRTAHHPFVNPAPPKIRKAIAIGVHGFFPAAFFHRFVGQPTGTSIRFANYAAASIKSWCAEHQPEIKGLEVEKVSLEGEGYISSRVDTLWKLLLNWLSHLRSAEFILIACHSQGVPVSIQLIAKLLQLGCLGPNVRIGVCAMAGINLGPFTEYKSRFLAGSASELFEFGDSNSKVSVAYADALDICLWHGVRITYVASLDDQLVSLESALHAPVTHPYVSRTIFIDGRLHSSNFLIHLVVFAAKLRNLGVSDHGLLRELSGPLAGSIVGGEGHSRVYDDSAVYMQAIEFALESTDVLPTPAPSKGRQASAAATPDNKRHSLDGDRRAGQAGYPKNIIAANHMRRGSSSSMSLAATGIAPSTAPYGIPIGSAAPAEKNPFVLPWAVRGMLSEDLVKSDPRLQQEVRELIEEFESWRPVSKGLKDVRWRLEGVRSLL